MMTCRCPMCGVKDAGRARARSFGAAHVGRDEHGVPWDAVDARGARRLRRRRERAEWRQDWREELSDA